jgi:hypothetical protein
MTDENVAQFARFQRDFKGEFMRPPAPHFVYGR